MCGLTTISAYHPAAPPVDAVELVRMRDHMSARGPDAAGAWISEDGRIGMGHRRLAIIDLDPRAEQPMVSSCGRYRIVFNGEIYNYQDLRAELLAAGAFLRTTSDTEVLVELFAREGVGCLARLRGMYAFAIWDNRGRALWLGRDPYGIKPLYYADDGRNIRAASQVKALLAGSGVAADLEPAGLVGYYLWGSVPEPFTLYRQITSVPAGHVVKIDGVGVHAPMPIIRIAEVLRRAEDALPASDSAAILRHAVLDSVRHHLVADVPVGLFLSAGVDSCALLAAIHAIDPARAAETTAITVTFPEYRGRADDEAPLAAEVARRYGARHVVREVSEAELTADLPRISGAMDQPSVDGVNTWLVSKAAAELGLKVALSGLGGDELLGGYTSFAELPQWVRRLRLLAAMPSLGRMLRRMTAQLGPRLLGWHPKMAGLVEHGGSWAGAYLLRRGIFLPHELPDLLGEDVAREGLRRLGWREHLDELLATGPRRDFGRVALLESALYMRNQLLRDTDWASMAHSLEVRVPLVDVPLTRAVAPIAAAGPGKALLADALGLPAAIASRPKTGFTTPVGTWTARATGARQSEPWARQWARWIGHGAGAPLARAVEPLPPKATSFAA